MNNSLFILLMFAGLALISCKNSSKKLNDLNIVNSDSSFNNNSILFKSDNLIVQRLSDHVYMHTSFLDTENFGRVDCNGMIVVNQAEAIVFDTPANNEAAEELIALITYRLKCEVKAVIPTHFHEDCVGGLEKFNEHDIPCYASTKTIGLLENENRSFLRPMKKFEDQLRLSAGGKAVHAVYFGEGHTSDNVIGYFPDDSAVFGGCLIKALGATKGNLADANVNAWPETVSKLKQKFPDVRIVIPGHGKPGTAELLNYTIALFE